jgi:hypothetical protein
MHDRDYGTLAALNKTSHSVHNATLPRLYESIDLRSEEDFAGVVGAQFPKGWSHVK